MDLQQVIDGTDLEITAEQARAFFVGAQSADHPLNFGKAIDELLAEHFHTLKDVENDLKGLWENVGSSLKSQAENLFPEDRDLVTQLTIAEGNLNYFLTAMSLAGTNSENAKNDHMMELIDTLEDLVTDLEDFIADPADLKEGERLNLHLKEVWEDFLNTKFIR